MNWKIINKVPSEFPTKGRYYDWKDLLADEGYNQCVYCSIHEGGFGGRRNFHVEHYKPKGIPRFKHLEHDYSNLFFSCCICNCFKSSYWEDDSGDYEVCFFPNPSQIDYSELFRINVDASISGINVTGSFIVEKLFLNRPQLIIDRRSVILFQKYDRILKFINGNITKVFDKIKEGDEEGIEILEDMTRVKTQLAELTIRLRTTVPYTTGDVTK